MEKNLLYFMTLYCVYCFSIESGEINNSNQNIHSLTGIFPESIGLITIHEKGLNIHGSSLAIYQQPNNKTEFQKSIINQKFVRL